MEGIALFIVIILSVIGYYAYKEYNCLGSAEPGNAVKGADSGNSGRNCLSCGYQGKMKTWLSNYSVPQFIVLLGLLFFFVPGLIFIAIYWGKYKCPSCGAVGKSQPLGHVKNDFKTEPTKKCPYCAEEIKIEAIICRYCQKEI